MNAIEMKHVTKNYASFSLKDLSLSLPCGCIMGLIGENGAGKSTTIKLLMNAIQRESGEIKILGQDNQKESFLNVKEEIGIVLEEACFPDALNAQKISRLMKSAYKNWQEDTFFQYISHFNLSETKPFKNYSKGMKMKLSIAAALSHQPKLLILDEPTSGLDPVVRDEIIEILNDFTREETHSILMSSHIISDLEKISDYIAYLHHGKLLFCEEKDHLLEEYAVLHTTEADSSRVPKEAILFKKEGKYSTELFVHRKKLSGTFHPEPAGLEEIMLFFAKKEV